MASSKTTTGFTDLPVELRLRIYSEIIISISAMVWPTHRPDSKYPLWLLEHMKEIFVAQRFPSSHDLYSYYGLLLSCKTVYGEFEHEWLKVYVPWFKKEFDIHNFDLPTISGWLQSPLVILSGVRKLANNLPSFCIYPISSLASDHTPLTREQIKRFAIAA
ncbi:uncharacterized protein J4E78_001002 [Alternaria triticimaculans]|uniref:uncharacterized protein n=1 Tax=Alternaria triticimaculans TaxID=297637 RepID=UPI0020C3E32D|nr:uncharacterized protein J4E78_001002 [Alternaria triticimaculans]KAI4672501.1 hypothetical protein J4E78_001002 [Alternaria triticimaculans]